MTEINRIINPEERLAKKLRHFAERNQTFPEWMEANSMRIRAVHVPTSSANRK